MVPAKKRMSFGENLQTLLVVYPWVLIEHGEIERKCSFAWSNKVGLALN
jgi:hypothetical protein